MNSQPGKVNIQEGRHGPPVVCEALLLGCLAVSVLGCNRPSVPVITDYGSGHADQLQARAFEILRDGLADADALVR